MSAFKCQAHMRELKQRLQLTMPTAVITEAVDADGLPAIKVALNSAIALAKIALSDNAGRVDGLGLPQRVYSPHVAKLIQDDEAAPSADLKILKARMVAAMAKLGMKLFISEDDLAAITAATAAGFDAAFTAATAVVTLPADEINPLTQSQ